MITATAGRGTALGHHVVVRETLESWPDGDWTVRQVTGSAATRQYRCPGCDQLIRPATPHLVAWPAESGGVDERRHWHTACWRARERRRPR